jgi:succinoglycan biosynthesis protein ExoM
VLVKANPGVRIGLTIRPQAVSPVTLMNVKPKIVVGLCTCRRPVMLARCLLSLRDQQIPSDLEMQLVIVENDELPRNKEAILQFAELSPFAVHYVHQPRRGIAVARNAVLNQAVEIGADWIAFIDDDETAASDWLAALMAPEYRDVPILAGHQQLVYPDPLPFWASPSKALPSSEGQVKATAATCNIRFSMEVVRSGLRFDESFGSSNGSDTDFFLRAHLNGFQIRQTLRAITYEKVHSERLTYRAQVYRSYCHGISLTRRMITRSGRQKTLWRTVRIVPRNLLVGMLEILVSPCLAVAGLRRFSNCAVSGGQRLGRAVGGVAGLFGVLPAPYRNIVGH